MESVRRHPDSDRSVTLMNGSQVMKTIQALTAALCLALVGDRLRRDRDEVRDEDSGQRFPWQGR